MKIQHSLRYGLILIENNMQVYEDIYKHMKRSKNNMIYHMHNDIDGTTKPEYLCRYITDTAKVILPVSKYIKNRVENCSPNNITMGLKDAKEGKLLYHLTEIKNSIVIKLKKSMT